VNLCLNSGSKQRAMEFAPINALIHLWGSLVKPSDAMMDDIRRTYGTACPQNGSLLKRSILPVGVRVLPLPERFIGHSARLHSVPLVIDVSWFHSRIINAFCRARDICHPSFPHQEIAAPSHISHEPTTKPERPKRQSGTPVRCNGACLLWKVSQAAILLSTNRSGSLPGMPESFSKTGQKYQF
jgi:hypothetical protein